MEGGDDPDDPSNYHPFYITNSISGGRLQNTQQQQMVGRGRKRGREGRGGEGRGGEGRGGEGRGGEGRGGEGRGGGGGGGEVGGLVSEWYRIQVPGSIGTITSEDFIPVVYRFAMCISW